MAGWSGWRLAFHLAALAHHLLVMKLMSTIDWEASNSELLVQLSQHSGRFYTVWNFILQALFLACSVLCDVGDLKPGLLRPILPSSLFLKKCADFKDFLFSTLLFPCAITVAVLYWSIFWYDSRLVGPPEMHEVVPAFANHAMHTFVVPVVVLELFLGKTKKPREHVAASMLCLALYISTYYAVLFGTYFTSGLWLYKLFEVMTWTQKAAFFVCHAVSLQVLFLAGLLAQELVPAALQERRREDSRPKSRRPGKAPGSKRHTGNAPGFKWDAFK